MILLSYISFNKVFIWLAIEISPELSTILGNIYIFRLEDFSLVRRTETHGTQNQLKQSDEHITRNVNNRRLAEPRCLK